MAMKMPGLQDHIRSVMLKMKKKTKLSGKTMKTEKPLNMSGLKLSLMKSIKGPVDKSAQVK